MVVVSSKLIQHDKEFKSLCNRERDDKSRRCNRTESNYFTVGEHEKTYEASSELTEPLNNQTIALVLRGGRIMKLPENLSQSNHAS